MGTVRGVQSPLGAPLHPEMVAQVGLTAVLGASPNLGLVMIRFGSLSLSCDYGFCFIWVFNFILRMQIKSPSSQAVALHPFYREANLRT